MIRIATGITANYIERSVPYLRSLEKHCDDRIKPTVFTVNFQSMDVFRGRIAPVDYSQALQLPKWMLQNGGFCDFAPTDWQERDVIIFTDADAVMQRPFDDEELRSIENLDGRQVMAGRNRPDGWQNLSEEAQCLSPVWLPAQICNEFPGITQMRCVNFGFVAAQLSTWRELLAASRELWPRIEQCFRNAAMVQWMMCYAIQGRGIKLFDLPLSVHAHGHLGLPPNVHCRDGIWMHNEKIIAYAHAL